MTGGFTKDLLAGDTGLAKILLTFSRKIIASVQTELNNQSAGFRYSNRVTMRSTNGLVRLTLGRDHGSG